MASFYPMYDFAVKVGGDCLMLIWQHFGKKEVYYIISAGLGEDIIENRQEPLCNTLPSRPSRQ